MDLLGSYDAFRKKLEQVKQANRSTAWEWYPYQSMLNVPVIAGLFEQAGLAPGETFGGAPVLDVGCADGDLTFWLESLRIEVDALDFGPTNYNGMNGVRRVAEAIGSRARIFERDLDGLSELPREHYGAVVALGLLYHLKNPFHFVEELAKHADYCLLSTRIMDSAKGVRGSIRSVPVAYLVDASECNGDATNFWIFSEGGVRRLVNRCGWFVRSSIVTGYSGKGDPARADRDKRLFCLLQNEKVNVWRGVSLQHGWHEMEEGRFRWTERRFSVRTPGAGEIVMKLWIPEGHSSGGETVVLRARADGKELKPEIFSGSSPWIYRRAIRRASQVEFETSVAAQPDASDDRERGLVVSSLDFWPAASNRS